MTDADKIVAFDNLMLALTNQWHDGRWSFRSPSLCGDIRLSRQEAEADTVAWAERAAKAARKKPRRRLELPLAAGLAVLGEQAK